MLSIVRRDADGKEIFNKIPLIKGPSIVFDDDATEFARICVKRKDDKLGGASSR